MVPYHYVELLVQAEQCIVMCIALSWMDVRLHSAAITFNWASLTHQLSRLTLYAQQYDEIESCTEMALTLIIAC